MSRVYFHLAAIIDWTPRLMLRVAIRGVRLGDEDLPRRRVYAHLWRVFREWFDWTTALPGDRFEDFPRQLLIEVRGGLPGRRRAGYVVSEAVRYPIVQRLGLDAVFALAPTEPSPEEWWHVHRVRDRDLLR